jgi:hypothetical protein
MEFTWSSSKQAQPLSRQLHLESLPATVEIFPSVDTFRIRLMRCESLSAMNRSPLGAKDSDCGSTREAPFARSSF